MSKLERNSSSANQSSGLNFNDDSLLDADESNDFELRNENYNLKITINNLEYEINKLSIDYQGKIKQLKQRYNALQRQYYDKVGQLQKSTTSLGQPKQLQELRSQNQYLSEENQQLRRKLQISGEENRVTPNFNSPQFAQDLATLNAYLHRPDSIEREGSLESQEVKEMKGKIKTFEAENSSLKQKLSFQQEQKRQSILKTKQECQQIHIESLKQNEKQLEQLRAENRQLTLQLTDSKRLLAQLNESQSDSAIQQRTLKQMTIQQRERQSKIVELEETINRLQVQNNRFKMERQKYDQEHSHYQTQKRDWQSKQKHLQEQLYSIENDFTEAKTNWLNQKLQLKKQYNNLKYQSSEEINQLKFHSQDKNQEAQRVKDSLSNVHQRNQELKQQQVQHLQAIEHCHNENNRLKDKFQQQNNELESIKGQLQQKQHELQQSIRFYKGELQSAKQQLLRSKDETRKSSIFVEKQQGKLQEDIKHKDDLIQILKIQKEQFSQKEKLLQTKIRQQQKKSAQKDKVILKLEDDIKNIKFDNNQLEIAIVELQQKNQTLIKIKADVEAMNSQLKTQKLSLKSKKEEEERLKYDNPSPKLQSMQQKQSLFASMRGNKALIDFIEAPDQLQAFKSNQSEEDIPEIIRILKTQNSELQLRVSELQTKLDQKAVDLSIKEQQLKTLKSDKFKQKKVEFDPMLQATKRNQFNNVFFENQVNQLKSQIKQVSAKKDKQIQQQKQLFKKKMEQKYFAQLKNKQVYIHELEKNINNTTNRQRQLKHQLDAMVRKCEDLKNQNYKTNVELSMTLQQQNQILQQCKHYQAKCHQLESQNTSLNSTVSEQYQNIKNNYQNLTTQFNSLKNNHQILTNQYDSLKSKNQHLSSTYETLKSNNYHLNLQLQSIKNNNQQLSHKSDEQSLLLKNANQQIIRLNEVLMAKQSQLKTSRCLPRSERNHSPNNSFTGKFQEKSVNRSYIEHDKSYEGEVIRIYPEKQLTTPSFSRI